MAAGETTNGHGDSSPTAQKSVIVTGGASGIGLAMASYFAAEGHQVAILDVSSSGAQVARDLAAAYPRSVVTFHQCDVSSWEDQAAAFKTVYERHGGRLDVVMANAGVSEQGVTTVVNLLEDEPSEPRLKSVHINLFGVVYSVKLAAHYMNKKPPGEERMSRGSIICTASNAGLYAFPTAPLYAASKAGVIGLVRSVGGLLERSKIQINALAPAVLVTNIAPDKALFKNMIVTPMSTLVRGVAQLLNDPSLTGAVAEIHGENVTLRAAHQFVDKDTETNLDIFRNLGYA